MLPSMEFTKIVTHKIPKDMQSLVKSVNTCRKFVRISVSSYVDQRHNLKFWRYLWMQCILSFLLARYMLFCLRIKQLISKVNSQRFSFVLPSLSKDLFLEIKRCIHTNLGLSLLNFAVKRQKEAFFSEYQGHPSMNITTGHRTCKFKRPKQTRIWQK